MTDRELELLDDVTGIGVSNCCWATVYQPGDQAYCQSCSEPCEAVMEGA